MFNFGTFSLGVLGASIRDKADLTVVDATRLTTKEAAGQVCSYRPDLIGVTVMGLASVRPAADFIRCLKAKSISSAKNTFSTQIIAGGHGASMFPIFLLEAGADAVVIGEGELTFNQLLDNGIEAGAKGLACVVESRLTTGAPQRLVEPLDQLQPPARDLMPPPADNIHLMETSRGCPHECAFCETTRFYGRRWRPHSPGRVVSEVRRLVNDFDAWIIHISDDNFAADRKRVLHICEELQKETLPAFFMVSARADDLVVDSELLPAMAAARILRITVGVETLDQETAELAQKPVGIEVYREAFERMRELGIFSIASFIVGLPGEMPEARENAVALAVEAGPDSAHFLPFLPLPGIPLSSKRTGLDPDPTDVDDAQRFNCEFLHHSTVQARLKTAAEKHDIKGLLARATLKKSKISVVSKAQRNYRPLAKYS